MPRSLNFRPLEAFRAVMLTGSITGAGHSLSVSQPAVSRALCPGVHRGLASVLAAELQNIETLIRSCR